VLNSYPTYHVVSTLVSFTYYIFLKKNCLSFSTTYQRHTVTEGVRVFNATFTNISVIPWRLDLLLDETGVPGETTDLWQVTIIYSVHPET